MTVRDMSARMKQLGRPILPSGITKIEQGERRVDADDLVALAIILEVNPNALLLPAEESLRPVHLAPTVSTWWWRAWEWATGELPLDVSNRSYPRLSELAEWFEMTRPHKSGEEITAEVTAAQRTRLTQQEQRLEEVDAEVAEDRARWRREHGER
jgi:hypothetical protein